MTNSITVDPQDALKAVIEQWDNVAPKTIKMLAEHLLYKCADRFYGDAQLMMSLLHCKRIDEAATLEALQHLWNAVEMDPGDYGGLERGDESQQYQKVRKFVESLFVERLHPIIDTEFERLAEVAGREATVEARANAYENAAYEMDGLLDGFGFETVDVEDLTAGKRALLMQLADAEWQPIRIDAAKRFLQSVYRHITKGNWSAVAESPLPSTDLEQMATVLVSDTKALDSILRYDGDGMIGFGKGMASTGTIAYKRSAELVREHLSRSP